jgi:Fe-S cluster biogenesis protein NfuA
MNMTDVVGVDSIVPDPREVAAHADAVSHLLRAHGGGIEVIAGDRPDVLRVRFTGLCTNCCLRPLTVATIVKPVLEDIDGVTDIEVEGIRISSEAMALI